MRIHLRKPKRATFCTRYFFEYLQIACTKPLAAVLMDISRLWDLNKKIVEELLYLLVFGVLEMKDGLDRTGKEKKG